MSQEKVKTMLYMQIFLGGGGEEGQAGKVYYGQFENSEFACGSCFSSTSLVSVKKIPRAYIVNSTTLFDTIHIKRYIKCIG